MKAPLNTDNWSGSIKSDKAPLNTDDWNGFISADMSRKLSQNCQCIKAPCNCGSETLAIVIVVTNVPTVTVNVTKIATFWPLLIFMSSGLCQEIKGIISSY